MIEHRLTRGGSLDFADTKELLAKRDGEWNISENLDETHRKKERAQNHHWLRCNLTFYEQRIQLPIRRNIEQNRVPPWQHHTKDLHENKTLFQTTDKQSKRGRCFTWSQMIITQCKQNGGRGIHHIIPLRRRGSDHSQRRHVHNHNKQTTSPLRV